MMFPVKVMNKCSSSRSALQKTMSLACEEVILFQVGRGKGSQSIERNFLEDFNNVLNNQYTQVCSCNF